MTTYPLSENQNAEQILTKTGKKVVDISLKDILSGNMTKDDMCISSKTLILQAEIAEKANKAMMGENLRRAAELVNVPDHLLLEFYNALRPNRSSYAELLAIARGLEENYGARGCAKLIKETAETYQKRGLLK